MIIFVLALVQVLLILEYLKLNDLRDQINECEEKFEKNLVGAVKEIKYYTTTYENVSKIKFELPFRAVYAADIPLLDGNEYTDDYWFATKIVPLLKRDFGEKYDMMYSVDWRTDNADYDYTLHRRFVTYYITLTLKLEKELTTYANN